MGIQERLDALQPRERKLLFVFLGALLVVGVLLLPIMMTASLAGQRSQNAELREAIDRLLAERDDILEQGDINEAILRRYRRPAPALGGFLDRHAKALEIEIPEFKDRPAIPRGNDYEERSTEIRIKKVGMRDLVLFLEKIGKAPYPVSVTKLTIRNRAGKKDAWDATMIVSAFHRKEAPKPSADEQEGEE